MSKFQSLSEAEIAHSVFQAQHDLVAARMRLALNKLDNTGTLKVLRKDIARGMTELRRREADQGLAKGTLLQAHRATFRKGAAAPARSGTFLEGLVDNLEG